MDFDDLDTYNGDTEHDMWVDFDNYENTGEPDVFYDEDVDDFIKESPILATMQNCLK